MATHAELSERRSHLREAVAASDERVREAARNSLNLSEFCLEQSQKHRAAPYYEATELRNAESHLDLVAAILREAEQC